MTPRNGSWRGDLGAARSTSTNPLKPRRRLPRSSLDQRRAVESMTLIKILLLVALLRGFRRSWGPRVEVPSSIQPFVLTADEHLRGPASPRKLFSTSIDFVEIF
jgi:hypothetical protein